MINQVRIGSVPYRVEYSHPVVNKEKDTVLWGEILQGDQLIKVDANLPAEMKRVVLLHEVIHGLLTHCGLSDHKEELPERLGYALDSFLTDNPQFVALYQPKSWADELQAAVSGDFGQVKWIKNADGILTRRVEES